MTIEERLKRVELDLARTKNALRQTRRLLGIGLLLALGVFSLAAVRDSPVVRARAFIVTDAQGQDRAVLGLRQDVPGLVLLDNDGKPRVDLAASPAGPYLRLVDSNGQIRAALSELPIGPALTVFDEKGAVRVGLGDFKAGPSLGMFDRKGKAVWEAR